MADITVIGVCSNKPRPSTQNSRIHHLKNGSSAWGRDVWHIRASGMQTLCGRDSSEWLNIGKIEIDVHLCARCAKKAITPPTPVKHNDV